MRILHTADWHLGKRLDFFSRLEEQQEVLDEICERADQQKVDLVIVAGDLFDTFNPPVEAVELLYRTLKRLTNHGKRPVIAIAGNHDSPDRIDAPDPLAKACGIIFVGYPDATIQTSSLSAEFTITNHDKGFIEIKLPSYDYPCRIITTPYANEIRLKQFLGFEDKDAALNQVLHENWKSLSERYCDTSGINILVTHLYMLNKNGEILMEPDGEKPIKIGNADIVYTDIIPPQIQYTALGHLHKYHNVGTEQQPVIYAGSPLSYSFSEANQQKHIVIVNIEPDSKPIVETIELRSGRILKRKKFYDMGQCLQFLYDNPNTLLELTLVNDQFINSNEIKSIHNAHDGVIHIIPISEKTQSEEVERPLANLEKDVKSLFVDFFESKYGQAPNESILNLFKEIVETEIE